MLFDDLPQEKKGSASSQNQEDNAQTEETATIAKTQQQDEAAEEEAMDSHVTAESKSKPKSLVDTIGNAGTTMAFVPAALRKRKTVVKTIVRPRKSQVRHQTSLDLDADTSSSIIHRYSESCEVENNQATTGIPDESNGQNNDRQQHEQEKEYKEPQHLTDLHASVRSADMYHPMMPNDYLAYKQRKENELLQANLEKQAQITLEMQRKLREQIEEERRKALDSGDVNKIIESRLAKPMEKAVTNGIGRGRGRGLSNLPAWLVKKQQEENQSTD